VKRSLFEVAVVVALASYFVASLSFLKIYYVAVALVAALALVLCFTGATRVPVQVLRDAGRLVLVFALFLASAFWADDDFAVIYGVAIDSIYLLVWFITYVWIRQAGRPAALAFALPVMIAAVYVYVYTRFGALRALEVDSYQHVGALANAGAITSALCIPFLFVEMSRDRRLAVAVLLVTGVVVLISGSRIAVLIAGAFAAWGILTTSRDLTAAVRNLALAVGATVVLVGAVAATEAGSEHFASFIDRLFATQFIPLGDESNVPAELERSIMYREAWEAFMTNPASGIGYQNLGSLIESKHGFPVVSHNLLITLLVEGNLVVAVAFGWLIARFFAGLARARRETTDPDGAHLARATGVAMGGVLLVGLFHPIISSPLFYIVLGIGNAIAADSAESR
jgi:hypothetical protein